MPLFAVLVWRLFLFLRDGRPASEHGSWLLNSLLALGFALPHSVLLHPRVKKVLGRWISPAFYGLFYCASTCISLLVVFHYWRGCGPVLWQANGWAATLIAAGFYASWAGLFYSLSLTGVGYQTGLTPWLYWVRGESIPRRDFTPRRAYQNSATSGVPDLHGPRVVHAHHDGRPRCAHRDLDGVFAGGQLAEGRAVSVLSRRELP